MAILQSMAQTPKKRTKPTKSATSSKTPRSRGGPKGKLAYDVETLALRKIDNSVITRYLTVNAHLTLDQLKQREKLPETSILERAIIRALTKISNSGDIYALNSLLDRMVGKIPNVFTEKPYDPYEGRTIEELLTMREALRVENEKTLKEFEKTERFKLNEQNVIDITESSTKKRDSK